MTDDLVSDLQKAAGVRSDTDAWLMGRAAARIEADAATIARLDVELQEQHRVRKAWAARAEAAEAKVAALVEALEQLVIEYDEVDLANAEPKSLTDAVSAARAAIAAAKGGA